MIVLRNLILPINCQLDIESVALPEAILFYFIIYFFVQCFLQRDQESGANEGNIALFQGFYSFLFNGLILLNGYLLAPWTSIKC